MNPESPTIHTAKQWRDLVAQGWGLFGNPVHCIDWATCKPGYIMFMQRNERQEVCNVMLLDEAIEELNREPGADPSQQKQMEFALCGEE